MKIAVLISGGVDSSVALRLLKDQGHDITAFYLKIWLEDELTYLGDCPWQEDLTYVEAVCADAGVPLEVVSMQREYWDIVVKYTIDEVKKGRTPNPDVLCNQRVKFGAFLKVIDMTQFDKVASGHYAHTIQEGGKAVLKTAPDLVKDQTYFLAQLSQEQLSKILFPLGDLDKPAVRALAEKYDLPNKARKDSQGICFLGKFKFSDFIRHHIGEQEGDLVEIETGEKLGTHKGFWFYTIGQRQGLGLAGGPWYVVDKDPETNIVYISRNYYTEDKIRNQFRVTDCNWISGEEPTRTDLTVKMRHGAHRHECTLIMQPDGTGKVTLAGHDQGIAPGQFAVFYDGDTCLGSGVIALST